jgi:mono/diheme cytochrome c family protein
VKGLANGSRSPGWFLALLPLFALLPGCGGESYSESMVYPARSDPVLREPAKKEFPEPDRPGQLPLLDLKDFNDPRNPYYGMTDVQLVDPKKLSREDRQELEEALQEIFGTPAQPRVTTISSEARQVLELDQETLQKGSQLYRLHCLQCHGLTGDGRGPTARWVNPHPRDYRVGKFKFVATNPDKLDQVLPRRDDLQHTLYQGVEGTAMQSYSLLPESDRNALVSYIIHLSIRGQSEQELLLQATEPKKDDQGGGKKDAGLAFRKLPGGSITGFLKGQSNKPGKVYELGERWREAQVPGSKIQPGSYNVKEDVPGALTKSIERGFDIFMGKGRFASDCSSCHLDFGRKAPWKFDDWGTLVKPRDLTQAVYRGGRRPIDLYNRIYAGITGSGMPNHTKLGPDQVWDLVNFVRALPYPAMRKDAKVVID